MIFKDTTNMGSFSEADFEQKLLYLKDTHDSISNLSSWCLSKHEHHAKIVSTWLNVLKNVKIEHRLILFYLANDVIQYSKRKALPFVDAFAPALQKATTMVREDNVRNKILRLFKIWDERGIYDEGFLVDLSSLLSHGHKNANGIDLQDFQPSVMYTKIRNCKELEDETDLRLKLLNDNHISFTDVEKLRNVLKDRTHGDDVISDFDEGLKHVKAYIDALEVEIKERSSLIDLLEIGEQHYTKEFKEAKVVVNAYKCFATRVRGVKRKLEEKLETMTSPIPSPDVNAPSPSPEPKDTSSGESVHALGEKEDLKRGYYSNEDRHLNDEKIPDSPYSPEPLRSHPDSSYIPPHPIIVKAEPYQGSSSPKVYVPPKVKKHGYNEYIKEEYTKPGDNTYNPSDKPFTRPPNFYTESSRESLYSGDKSMEGFYGKNSNKPTHLQPDKVQPNYYKSTDQDDLYSPKDKSPKVKQEYFQQPTSIPNMYLPPEKVPPIRTSDTQPFIKSSNVEPYSVEENIPLIVPCPQVNNKYIPKSVNDNEGLLAKSSQSYYPDYIRDDYSKSSNDDTMYSPSDKILPDNFVRDGSFSKTAFADTLKEFYSSRNTNDSVRSSSRNSGRSNGVEGNRIEVVSSSPKEKMTLSALLQTLIPPESSTLHTIEPQSPDQISEPPAAAKYPPWAEPETAWETPESPPSYEKSAYPPAFEDQTSSQDVDMRFFDVDHRNLISLTNNDNSEWSSDADYRKIENPPLPQSPNAQANDDVENVDMEMSDDEEKLVDSIKNDSVALLRYSPPKSDILNIPVQNSRSYPFGSQGSRAEASEYKGKPSQEGERKAYTIPTVPYSSPAYKPPATESKGDCLTNLLPLPPPPPPPPPPQPQHSWGQTPPFPGQPYPSVQQVPIYFNRPPPSIPIQGRPFRPNFRPFHRGPPRFQRW